MREIIGRKKEIDEKELNQPVFNIPNEDEYRSSDTEIESDFDDTDSS